MAVMRTYHIHSKITSDHIHILISLSKTPPAKYEYIRDIPGNTTKSVIRDICNQYDLIPVKIKISSNAQTTFISDVRELE